MDDNKHDTTENRPTTKPRKTLTPEERQEKREARQAHAKERPDILDLIQAADYLQISTITLQRLLNHRADPPPARKLGREWRFSRDGLKEWVARGQKARDEAEAPQGEGGTDKLAEHYKDLGQKASGRKVIAPSIRVLNALIAEHSPTGAIAIIEKFWSDDNADYWRGDQSARLTQFLDDKGYLKRGRGRAGSRA